MSTTYQDRSVVTAATAAAMSDTTNQWRSARFPAASDSHGTVNRPGESRPVSCLSPPPSRSMKNAPARYCGGAERDQVDRDSRHDVVHPEGHRGDRVEQPADGPHHRGAEDPDRRLVVVGEVRRTPGAEDHLALEPDVDHAGPLAPQAADAGHQDRAGREDRSMDRARRVDAGCVGDHSDDGDQQDRAETDDQPLVCGSPLATDARQRSEWGPGSRRSVAHTGTPCAGAPGGTGSRPSPTARCSILARYRRTTS